MQQEPQVIAFGLTTFIDKTARSPCFHCLSFGKLHRAITQAVSPR